MTTSTKKVHQRPSRRSRHLKRRFSSASAIGTHKKLHSLSVTTLLHTGTRQTFRVAEAYASIPPRSPDSSETEEELDLPFPLHSGESTYFSRGEPRALHYASLPPTPILPSTPRSYSPPPPPLPPPRSTSPPFSHSSAPPFSLWDYLREELLATDFDSHQELKWDRVSNFLSIPVAMEKVSKRNSFFKGNQKKLK
jgi:hypothetical protein